MRETIKKGMIECAWFSTWCSHAEEYGFKAHGGFGGCAIEQIAPTPDFAQMSDVADRVLARLEAAFASNQTFREDCRSAVEWLHSGINWSDNADHSAEYAALTLAADYPVCAALACAAQADNPTDTDAAWSDFLSAEYQDRFGTCLAYELAGSGVAWSDDHADVLPRIPNDSRLEEHADPIISASCARCALPEEIERTRSGGKLPAFSSVGSYPLFYANKDGETFCASCADDRHHHVTEVDVNYEDESLYCDDCEAEIESAYGASDESEES